MEAEWKKLDLVFQLFIDALDELLVEDGVDLVAPRTVDPVLLHHLVLVCSPPPHIGGHS